jgi:predicted Fe-Mo cluster-binding NifX family protein
MKVCIPVEEYRGLDSNVCGHFGSARVFALVETDTLAIEPLNSRDEQHEHGACSRLKAIGGGQVNAVIVGGIGAGAIRGLNAAGIEVFGFVGGTVADAVQQFKAGALPVLNARHACGGHAAGYDCHHHTISPA